MSMYEHTVGPNMQDAKCKVQDATRRAKSYVTNQFRITKAVKRIGKGEWAAVVLPLPDNP
jgi:hypothetical protein